MKKLHKKTIKKVVNQAVNKINPLKVILFGSYAYGKPNRDSDVDLLFVTDTKLKGLKRYSFVSQNIDHVFAMDIIVKSPAEIKKRLAMGDPFYKEILKKGELLYESK